MPKLGVKNHIRQGFKTPGYWLKWVKTHSGNVCNSEYGKIAKSKPPVGQASRLSFPGFWDRRDARPTGG